MRPLLAAALLSLPLLAQAAVVIAGFACVGAAVSTRYGTRELLD